MLWLFPDSFIHAILPQIEHVGPPVLFVACCVNQEVEAEMKENCSFSQVRGHTKFLDILLSGDSGDVRQIFVILEPPFTVPLSAIVTFWPIPLPLSAAVINRSP